MNKTKRKQIHTALVNAVAHLAGPRTNPYSTKKEEYICFAIGAGNIKNLDGGYSAYTPGAMAAKRIIESRLSPFSSLDCWLERDINIPGVELNWKNMQKHRHAWLKLLIKEFSK
jgi:hypothetical protein